MATLEEALYAKLTGDTTLMALVTAVYTGIAPEKQAAYPFVLIQLVSGNDDYTFTRRVSTVYRYQIKVVDDGLDAETHCRAAMNRIDALLTDATLTVTGFSFWRMRRSRLFSYVETTYAGKTYQHVGGEWIIELAPA